MANKKATFKAACCIGKQPNSNAWILGHSIQISSTGTLIREEHQDILWVHELHLIEDRSRRENAALLPKIITPLLSTALKDVVESMAGTVHDNFIAGVFTIGEWHNSRQK